MSKSETEKKIQRIKELLEKTSKLVESNDELMMRTLVMLMDISKQGNHRPN